ncbi:MAG: hypothetical protein AAF456_02400 [Planctomycetota bacterium]
MSSKEKWIAIIWLVITVLIACLIYFFASVSDKRVAGNTVLLGLLAAALAIPGGAITAWAAMGRGLFSRLLLISCVGLLFVPLFLQVAAWDSALGKLGWFSSAQGQVVQPLVAGWPAAVWVHALAAIPQVAIVFLLGLSTGSRVFEDQALLETGRWNVFAHVTLPRLAPLILIAGLWVMVSCAREIAATDLYKIGTLAEQIYLGFSLGQFNPIQGTWSAEQLADAAATGPLITIAVVLWLAASAVWLFFSATGIDAEEADQQRPLQQKRSTGGQTVAAFSMLLIMVAVPVWNLFFRAGFFVAPVDGKPVQSWSIEQVGVSIARVFRDFSTEFSWSLVIALVSASVILLIVVPFVWAAATSRAARLSLVIVTGLTCAIPGPLIGTWLSRGLGSLTSDTMIWLYDRTIFAPVVACVLFCWPVAALVAWFVFRKVAVDSLESARLEGAGWWSRFFQFAVAGNRTALAGCWLITLALCFGELSASQMVLPPGMDTVPRLTLGLLHAGVDEMTAALTIVTVSGIVLVSLPGWLLLRIAGRRVDTIEAGKN